MYSSVCNGRYTSGAAAGSTPKKSGGATPTTVNGRLLIRTDRPAAVAGPPKRRWLKA
jgi:hypothetical protein